MKAISAKFTKVKDLSSKNLTTVKWSDSLLTAYRLMEERRIRHLPVRDEEGAIIGILSDRDVSRAMKPERTSFQEDAVAADFMSWPILTVDEETPIQDVAEGMIDEKLSCFLVTRGKAEIVGIITTEDLLRLFLDNSEIKSSLLKNFSYSPIYREITNEAAALGL